MRWICGVLTLALVALLSVSAQTKLAPAQITCIPSGVSVGVIGSMPAGSGTGSAMVCIPIDSTTLQIIGGKLTVVFPSSSLTFVDGETPTGMIDGTNRNFTLAASPNPATSLALYRNGVRQKFGVDYTLAGNAITFLAASTPESGAILTADYRR